MVCVRVARRLSACALPRPSAIASAKFANTTVNQSQTASWSVKPQSLLPPAMSRDEHERGERAADEHDEHHRVPHHVARVELAERIADRAAHDLRVEQRTLGDGHLRTGSRPA